VHLVLDAFFEADRASLVKVLVVGIGNPDRGDDAAGLHVARELDGRVPAEVSVVARRDDLLSLIGDWHGVETLVFVDAAASNGCPGRVHRFDLATDELPRDLATVSGHFFGLADTIALARTLGLAPPRILVFAVEGACFNIGAPITPEVTAGCAATVDEIVKIVGWVSEA
jgi:hydrogenase maturation protease